MLGVGVSVGGLAVAGVATVLTRSSKPSPSRLASRVEFSGPQLAKPYKPEFDRIHSAGVYRAMATKSIAVEVAHARAERATVPASISAIEYDLFFDDVHERSSEVVLMGERGGWRIGFCYRFLVDLGYPSEYAEADGFGTVELGTPELTLLGRTFTLRELGDVREPSEAPSDTVWVRYFDEHDAALIFVPKRGDDHEHLGIDDVAAVVEHALNRCESLFGLEFILMSPASFERMRMRLAEEKTRLDITLFAAGMAVAALALWPLVGSSSTLSLGTLESVGGRELVAKALPIALKLGQDLLLEPEGFVARHFGEHTRIALLGLELPRRADELARLWMFSNAAAQRDASAQLVGFGSQDGRQLAQVFLPDSNMNLNAELLSRGLARFDLDDVRVADDFPELLDAALAAIETKQGSAERWAGDTRYVERLRALRG
jgi:hypothetical protein